jgi:hypothetical protein
LGDEERADDHARQQIAKDDLQESEIGVEGQPGDADDGQGAGFGGDDGERNRPPGNVAVGQEVIAQAALRFAKAQSEDRDRRQIKRDDCQVDRVQPVDSCLRLTFHVSGFTFHDGDAGMQFQ